MVRFVSAVTISSAVLEPDLHPISCTLSVTSNRNSTPPAGNRFKEFNTNEARMNNHVPGAKVGGRVSMSPLPRSYYKSDIGVWSAARKTTSIPLSCLFQTSIPRMLGICPSPPHLPPAKDTWSMILRLKQQQMSTSRSSTPPSEFGLVLTTR